MATLAALKAKWFIDTTPGGTHFPPRARAPGTAVTNHTDGNLVTPFIDGEAYMAEWNARLGAVASTPSAEFYHTGWKFNDVETLGVGTGTDARAAVAAARAAGRAVYPVFSDHIGNANGPATTWLRAHGVPTACRDTRFPAAGSNHQKAHCFKVPNDARAGVGSIDIARERWDRTAHDPGDALRPGRPTHDLSVTLQGAAVADIERCFTERWNDPTRARGPLVPGNLDGLVPPPVPPPITTAPSAPLSIGSQSVQVLRTFGRTYPFFGYSWATTGEFTAWASYLNAIQQAQHCIYIEDQYFWPFDFPPAFLGAGRRRDTDIIYQLARAIQRGVKVAVLVPANAEDIGAHFLKYQRDIGVHYLNAVAAAGTAGGEFVIGSLQVPDAGGVFHPVYVHSKVMLVDDELALMGSANVGQRSMSHDGELHLGIVDAATPFVADLRKALWAEHMAVAPGSFTGLASDYAAFKAAVVGSTGRLFPYPVDPLGPPPIGHADFMRNIADPYAGPPR